VFDEVEVLEVAPHAASERGRDRHRGRVAVAHEPLTGVPLEVAEPVPELRLERLVARIVPQTQDLTFLGDLEIFDLS